MSYEMILDEMTWSFSRLSSFDQCPYEWYLKYIEEAEQYNSGFFSSFGGFCHEILEAWLKGEHKTYELAEMFVSGYDEAIPNAEDYSWNDGYFDSGAYFFTEGIETLSSYLNGKIVCGVEKEIHTTINDKPFIGYIDVLLRDNNGYIIVDHKSSKYPLKKNGEPLKGSENKWQNYKRQLYLYAKAIYEETGLYPTRLCWNFFRDGMIYEIPFNMNDYQEALNWAEETIEKIYSERKYEPNPDMFYCANLCDYSCEECGYGSAKIRSSARAHGVQSSRCDDKN